MSEPSSTTLTSGIIAAGLVIPIDTGVLVGAFAGSVLFVMSDKNPSILHKLLYFLISIIVGIIAAKYTANFITALTPGAAEANDALGALVASMLAIKVLTFISDQSPGDMLNKSKRGRND